MILAILLAFAGPQDACVNPPEDWSSDDPTPYQASGEGLWIGGIGFDASDIASAIASQDAYEMWGVEVRFSAAGNAKFLSAQRCGVGRPVEISVDRKAISHPTLNEPVTGGTAVITGGFDQESAAALARRLSGG